MGHLTDIHPGFLPRALYYILHTDFFVCYLGHPVQEGLYGSGDIAAAMRNIIKIEVDKKNPTKRTLRVIKSNLDGACFEPVGIRQDEEKKIYLCNPRENGNENQIDLAVQIIQSKMKNDRALADEVDALMGEAGIQSRTVGRAQSRVNVRRKKIGGVSYLVKKEPKPENDV